MTAAAATTTTKLHRKRLPKYAKDSCTVGPMSQQYSSNSNSSTTSSGGSDGENDSGNLAETSGSRDGTTASSSSNTSKKRKRRDPTQLPVFEQPLKFLKIQRDRLEKLCVAHKHYVPESEQLMENIRKDVAVARNRIVELTAEIEKRLTEKNRRRRERVREKFVKIGEWAFTKEACPICYEFYKLNVIYDNCDHVLCRDCNAKLLKSERNEDGRFACPLCRCVIDGYSTFNEKTLHVERTLIKYEKSTISVPTSSASSSPPSPSFFNGRSQSTMSADDDTELEEFA